MPDIDDLDHFSQGLPVVPTLPAAEIRRRGDRLRRRNTALVAGGVLAAALAIGAPVVALSGDGQARTIQPTDPDPAPKQAADVDWRTSIVKDFPIDAGMGTPEDPPHVGVERGEVVFSGIEVCNGPVAWSPERPYASTDTLGAVWSDGVSGGEQRTLATYPDQETAEDALTTVELLIADCEPTEVSGDGQEIEPTALDSDTGDESFAYVDRYVDADGYTGEANVFLLTRVGNALLIDKTYVGGAGDLTVGQQTVEQLTERSAEVVASMCVFAEETCTTIP